MTYSVQKTPSDQSDLSPLRIGAIVQARMSSVRLPGKVLRKVQNKPLLAYVLESLSHCDSLDTLAIATSMDPLDDEVESFCTHSGVACHRGVLEDVAKRLLDAAEFYRLDAFVRISGDSPLMDYRLVDKGVKMYREGLYDLVTNVLKRTYPSGCSVEVLSTRTMKLVYPLLESGYEREHVTPFFYANRVRFRIRGYESGGDYGRYRLTVDTPEDLHRFESIVSAMEKHHCEYTFEEILQTFTHLFHQ
jgi:spore coat polysaccharide biosynthesis protein SpsF